MLNKKNNNKTKLNNPGEHVQNELPGIFFHSSKGPIVYKQYS